ncbi:MAG: tyrosine-type recombinase/integrase [Flavobacteriales bacterium]|nr:tyrosine-type recombinase/integrase [Flavobacteriales bacterium]
MDSIIVKQRGGHLEANVPNKFHHEFMAAGHDYLGHDTFSLPHNQKSVSWLLTHFKKRVWVNLSDIGIGSSKTFDASKFQKKQKEVRATESNKKWVALSEVQQNLVKDFEEYMLQKRLAVSTVSTYKGMMIAFLIYFKDVDPFSLTKEDVERFNYKHIIMQKYSNSYQRQMISALKMFYSRFEKKAMRLETLEYVPKSKKLPTVLSKSEVKLLLKCIKNLKHHVAVSLIYSCGLRMSELLNLKVTDISFDRKQVHIRQSKGAKDRVVPMGKSLIPIIKSYLKTYQPKEFLIEGQNGQRYSSTSINKIIKRSAIKSGITKPVTAHSLRHSYATHLLDANVDIRYIQELLGHNSLKTTMIYTHVSIASLDNIPNPLDTL